MEITMMKRRKTGSKLLIGLGFLILFVMAVVAVSTLHHQKDFYNGIYIVFEEDTPPKSIQSVIEKYCADDTFNNMPHYIRLTFFHKSDQEVKDLVSQLMDEEYVIKASYVRVSASALEQPQQN